MDNVINRQEIKRIIETRTCPTHQEHPTVELTSKGISLKSCCETFKESLAREIKSISADHAKKYAQDQIRRSFGQ